MLPRCPENKFVFKELRVKFDFFQNIIFGIIFRKRRFRLKKLNVSGASLTFRSAQMPAHKAT